MPHIRKCSEAKMFVKKKNGHPCLKIIPGVPVPSTLFIFIVRDLYNSTICIIMLVKKTLIPCKKHVRTHLTIINTHSNASGLNYFII